MGISTQNMSILHRIALSQYQKLLKKKFQKGRGSSIETLKYYLKV